MANPRAYIRLRGAAFDFRCPLGRGRPRPTGGGAEYEAGKRPQSDAVTLFTGNGLLMLDVPVLFDGWGSPGQRRDVGPHLDQVYALCFGRGRKPPPNFIASGPFQGSGGRFQMALPEESDDPEPIVGDDGTVYRQALVLKLIEFNDPTTILYRKTQRVGVGRAQVVPPIGIGPAEVVDPPPSVVLDRPQNLLEIAAHFFGSADEAARLGRLNGIADLRKKLPQGTRVKLEG